MIKTGAISLQSPLLEADPPAPYSSIQECYLQEAENSLLSGSFWVHVKQLITALVIFRAPVRWWSIQSLLHPFIHPCNNPCRSQESVAIFIFQPRKWGIGVLTCKCRQPKGERRCQPGETAPSSLWTVSAPSVELPWSESKHFMLRQFSQLVSAEQSQISLDISIVSSSSLLSRSLSRSSL